MLELLKKQRFGVEVEFTGITRAHAASILSKAFNSGIEANLEYPYYTRKMKDEQGRSWKIVRDSSIRPVNSSQGRGNDNHRCEMVTPILNYQDIETLQDLIRKLKSEGAVVNSSCGIHIHVDGANHNPESIKRLTKFVDARQDLIYTSLKVSNARKEQYCQSISHVLVEKLQTATNMESIEKIWYSPLNDGYSRGISHAHYNSTRYHALNLHSLFTKGTIEFRLFNSTLHAGKIKAYIQFCLALSAWSIESQKNISFRETAGYTMSQQKTLMRNILVNRLQLTGDEFKTCRYHMTKNFVEEVAMAS